MKSQNLKRKVYQHNNHSFYQVVNVAKNTQTHEEIVIYQKFLKPISQMWCISKKEFENGQFVEASEETIKRLYRENIKEC